MATIEENLQSLVTAKSDIADALTAKGVTVPDGAGLLDFSELISDISTGSPVINGTITKAYIVVSGSIETLRVTGTSKLCADDNFIYISCTVSKTDSAFSSVYVTVNFPGLSKTLSTDNVTMIDSFMGLSTYSTNALALSSAKDSEVTIGTSSTINKTGTIYLAAILRIT